MSAVADPVVTRLVDVATALDPERFEQLFTQLLRVRDGKASTAATPTDAELIARVAAGPPEETWARLDQLRERMEDGTLTPEELTELLGLNDHLERLHADRMAALAVLAVRRGRPLPELMAEFGIGPRGAT